MKNDNIFYNNIKLTIPKEFYRVAVISPENSAGLGDFKRDADVLNSAELCLFDYFFARFQGSGAVNEIIQSIQLILSSMEKYDVICIIRGGGAVSDLSWLDDLELARIICKSTIPIFTGIAHILLGLITYPVYKVISDLMKGHKITRLTYKTS